MPLRRDSQTAKLSAPIYKWEFIRRNQKYKADYKNYYKKIVLNRGKTEKHFATPEYISSKDEQAQYFYKEYGMGVPFDPDMSFAEHLKQRLKGYKESSPQKRALHQIMVAKKMVRKMFPYDSSVICLDPYKVKLSLNQASLLIPWNQNNKIEVKIDIRKPLLEIISDTEFIVKTARKVLGIKEEIKNDRNQWALYDDYLEIYDMEHKKGKALLQNSFHFHNGKLGIDDKIRKSLKAAEKMVSSGFRKIGNFPIPF